MSTKSSIAWQDTWHLYEEMLHGVVRLEMNDASAQVKVAGRWHSVIVDLPPDVLDAIAKAHASKSFPHQVRPTPTTRPPIGEC